MSITSTKKILLCIAALSIAWGIASPASAACVNNISTDTGRPCFTVTPSQPQGNSTGNGSVAQNITPGQNLPYAPLEPIPNFNIGQDGTAINFPTLLNSLFRILFTIGALFSVVMLTISGIRYMVSEVVSDKSKALHRIQACIYGILLLAGAWLILHTINPELLNFNLNPCPQGSGLNCNISAVPQNSAPVAGTYPQINPTTQYRDSTSCTNSGNVWMNDSQNCIPPISTTLNNLLDGSKSTGDLQKILNTTPNATTCEEVKNVVAFSAYSTKVWAGILFNSGPTKQGEMLQSARAYASTCATMGT